MRPLRCAWQNQKKAVPRLCQHLFFDLGRLLRTQYVDERHKQFKRIGNLVVRVLGGRIIASLCSEWGRVIVQEVPSLLRENQQPECTCRIGGRAPRPNGFAKTRRARPSQRSPCRRHRSSNPQRAGRNSRAAPYMWVRFGIMNPSLPAFEPSTYAI